LLGRNIGTLEKVDYLNPEAKDGEARWIFISWDGPPDGVVYVLSCNGHVLAERRLGYLERLEFGPYVLNRATIEAWYIPGSGTGINDHSIAILMFDGKSIRILWDHPVDDSATEPADMFRGEPQSNGMRTDEQTYHWEYGDREEKLIKVTGRETRATENRTIRRILPPEKYCFRAAEMKYARCK
jgi:hypothetical protein